MSQKNVFFTDLLDLIPNEKNPTAEILKRSHPGKFLGMVFSRGLFLKKWLER